MPVSPSPFVVSAARFSLADLVRMRDQYAEAEARLNLRQDSTLAPAVVLSILSAGMKVG